VVFLGLDYRGDGRRLAVAPVESNLGVTLVIHALTVMRASKRASGQAGTVTKFTVVMARRELSEGLSAQTSNL